MVQVTIIRIGPSPLKLSFVGLRLHCQISRRYGLLLNFLKVVVLEPALNFKNVFALRSAQWPLSTACSERTSSRRPTGSKTPASRFWQACVSQSMPARAAVTVSIRKTSWCIELQNTFQSLQISTSKLHYLVHGNSRFGALSSTPTS